jgi:hypothetical protein
MTDYEEARQLVSTYRRAASALRRIGSGVHGNTVRARRQRNEALDAAAEKLSRMRRGLADALSEERRLLGEWIHARDFSSPSKQAALMLELHQVRQRIERELDWIATIPDTEE